MALAAGEEGIYMYVHRFLSLSALSWPPQNFESVLSADTGQVPAYLVKRHVLADTPPPHHGHNDSQLFSETVWILLKMESTHTEGW